MLLIVIVLIVISYGAVMAFRLRQFTKAAKAAATITHPYTRLAKRSRQHLLVLGDSTMYGAGIKDPRHTIGGLLAAKYPHASIETLATNGARVKDMRQQLAQAGHSHYDLIQVGVGGNDIVHFSNYTHLERDLSAFLQQASQTADKIILTHCVNVGNIGFFAFPLNLVFAHRSRQLSRIYATVAAPFANVRYVNFYRPIKNDYYTARTRKRFIADDAFHPSDYANRYFFDLIWKEIQK